MKIDVLVSVEKRRLERPTPTSRTWCATNCATSRSRQRLLIISVGLGGETGVGFEEAIEERYIIKAQT